MKIFIALILTTLFMSSAFAQKRDIIKPVWSAEKNPVWQVEILKDKTGKRIEYEVYETLTKKKKNLLVSCLRHVPSKQEFCVDDVVSIKDYVGTGIAREIKSCTIWFISPGWLVPFDEKNKTETIYINCREIMDNKKMYYKGAIDQNNDVIKMINKCSKGCQGR